MATLRETKDRIKSVVNTAKITKAMQMVSASRMVRAQVRSKNAEPYSEGLYEMFSKIGKIAEYKHPFLEVRDPQNICFLIIGPSRGFVGGMISSITLEIATKVNELKQKYPGVNFHAVSMHRVGSKIANRLGFHIDYHFPDFIDNPNTTQLSPLKSVLSEKFTQGEYDQIYVAYTKFINTGRQDSVVKKVLPIEIEEKVDAEADSAKQYIFEPNVASILDRLIPEYFENQIYSALLQSIASEHSARMVAMKNATDNANELKDKLTLFFNRSRQASITQQLIEIVSASYAD